jgi:Fe-S cluster assembly protein SufD
LSTSAPTRHNEAWRYSDIAAVEAAWPLPAPESIIVPAGGTFARTIIQDSGTIHQLDIAIGKGATAAIHVLNIGGDYGRVELNVTLHEKADFKLGAVQIGGGTQTLEVITTVTHAEPGATSSPMLLDRSATANTKPELEIYADDVKCAHGCAIGELDAMGLFYLQARGITPAEAKKLMLQAFVAGVFEGAADEEALTEAALTKLGELV